MVDWSVCVCVSSIGRVHIDIQVVSLDAGPHIQLLFTIYPPVTK